jgi:hypothetical protein
MERKPKEEKRRGFLLFLLDPLPSDLPPPAVPFAKNFVPQNGYNRHPSHTPRHPLPPAKVIGVIVLLLVLLYPLNKPNSLIFKVVEARGVEPLYRQPRIRRINHC